MTEYNEPLSLLRNLLNMDEDYSRLVIDSLYSHSAELDHIEELEALLWKKDIPSNRLGRKKAEVLYSIVRQLKPQVVVETGVATGYSSSMILMALEDNKMGHLCSVDYPNYQSIAKKIDRDIRYKGPLSLFSYHGVRHIVGYIAKKRYHVPNGKESGWVIPDRLRDRWTLKVGLSEKCLPAILQDVKQVDVFLHDSDHAEENMLNEYRMAWPYIRNGGLLLSDDIALNNAFSSFSMEVNPSKVISLEGNFGIMIK